MTKLRAAARDRAAQSWKERKFMHKVGCTFAVCARCGSQNVFKSNQPVSTGWTLYCWDCSSKDAGLEIIRSGRSSGSREADMSQFEFV